MALAILWSAVFPAAPGLGVALAASPEAPSAPATTINSAYAATPPQLDGSVGFGEWDTSNTIPFHSGFITVRNDNVRLYVLIDVLSETTNDPNDYFWVTFDKNQNAAIDSRVDLNYGLQTGTGNMRYQFYLGPSSWTGILPDTYSARAKGYGCFWADGSQGIASFRPLRFSCTQHRVWELAFDLKEIGTFAGGTAKMGIRTAAPANSILDDVPANFFNSFTNLVNINLAPPPFFTLAPFPGARVAFEVNPIEVTQAVQTRTNTLGLVANKDTVARVYTITANVPFANSANTYLYGSVGAVDLPGSPMVVQQRAPTVINRNNLNDTANFRLPKSWTSGNVTFTAKATDPLNNTATGAGPTIAYTPKAYLTVWIVPVNTGSTSSPVLPPQSEIDRQESYFRAIYPLSDIHFVQKPWTVLGVVTGEPITALNTYYNTVVLGWLLTVIFNGGISPFDLPDEIYGFTPSGGGLSDPVWAGGVGRVARGFQGTSLEGTMAHETNHNLDRSNNGTWGRHVPNGCGAAGPDPNWPYANSNINEVGFDTRLPWSTGGGTLTVIPNTVPDIMSYCQSGFLPTKWISPYRWTNLFNTLPSPAAAALATKPLVSYPNVFYVTGSLHEDKNTKAITGNLNPIFTGPGMADQSGKGNFSIQFLDAQGALVTGFTFPAQFIDDPEEPVDTVHFSFAIPQPIVIGAAVTKVVLMDNANQTTLDTIDVSQTALTVGITAPVAGANWSGTQTLQWTATNAANDTFNVFFSPDSGGSWQSVASGLHGVTSLSIDTTTLPNTTTGRLRVYASDGFNNAQADSANFTVNNAKPPTVEILSPTPSSAVLPGEPFNLVGDGATATGTPLPEDHLVWQEGLTVLGSGRNVSASLAPGFHTLTLTGQDFAGLDSQANVKVFVGYQTFISTVYR